MESANKAIYPVRFSSFHAAGMTTTPRCSAGYSTESAEKTLEWMTAIADFIRPFKPLIDAHVVNFFKDRMWEAVDAEWMRCLKSEPVDNLLGIPSGVVMEHWPASLQKFVLTIKSLAFFREQQTLDKVFPNLHVASLDSVLAQGMNMKKKHEVEILASVIRSVANDVGAKKIIDVGAGQGYLAQVLSFEYQLSVVAIDASSHHSSVTSARAERIKKHYASKLCKSLCGNEHLNPPQAVTCHVLSSNMLSALSMHTLQKDLGQETNHEGIVRSEEIGADNIKGNSCIEQNPMPLVLAGLHACGDLSVNMLRTFIECEEIKALACVGCCYNLLSEEASKVINTPCGFPMSNGAKSSGVTLTKNARDLACQSAERWRNLSNSGALQNFDLHIFRAAFQMVLEKYYPEVIFSNPSIGRKGKALRRQQSRRQRYLQHNADSSQNSVIIDKELDQVNAQNMVVNSPEGLKCVKDSALEECLSGNMFAHSPEEHATSCGCGTECKAPYVFERSDKYSFFEEFSMSALDRLGFKLTQDIDLLSTWEEAKSFAELVGPYWSLRASFGPLLETYLLLDRLLFLQEQGSSVQVMMFPLFDPIISPRNILIIARK